MNFRIIGYIGAVVAIIGLGWYARSVISERDSLRIEVTNLDDRLEAAGLEIATCEKQKVVIENVAKTRIDKIRDLTKQRDADKLFRDPKSAQCVPVIE